MKAIRRFLAFCIVPQVQSLPIWPPIQYRLAMWSPLPYMQMRARTLAFTRPK